MATFSGTFSLQLKLEERGTNQSILYLFLSPAGMTKDGRIAKSMAGFAVKNLDATTQHPILAGYRKQLEEAWPHRTSWCTHVDSPILWHVTGTCHSLDRRGNPMDAVLVEAITPVQ